jgi:hypothetical protein
VFTSRNNEHIEDDDEAYGDVTTGVDDDYDVGNGDDGVDNNPPGSMLDESANKEQDENNSKENKITGVFETTSDNDAEDATNAFEDEETTGVSPNETDEEIIGVSPNETGNEETP